MAQSTKKRSTTKCCDIAFKTKSGYSGYHFCMLTVNSRGCVSKAAIRDELKSIGYFDVVAVRVSESKPDHDCKSAKCGPICLLDIAAWWRKNIER